MSKAVKEDYEGLGRELTVLIRERGLGAIPKRDLDALILYLFEKHLGWATWSNQELSIALRLAVPKVKSLRYEGSLRFTEDLDAEFAKRIRRVLRQAAFDGTDKRIRFIVEDYATRFVLEEYVKKQGTLPEWQFNEEGISVPPQVVARLLSKQFSGKEREDAMTRLKVADPDGFDAAVIDAFTELVDAATETRVVKLAKLATSLTPGAKQAKALWDLLSA